MLNSEFLYTAGIEIDDALDLGATPHGYRCIVLGKQGTFEGPKLKGEVLPGGTDWPLRRSDGVSEIDVRNTYRTNDGCLIYVSYRGLLSIPSPEIWQRITQNQDVDPSEYYFRITPRFETGSEKYAWLNRIMAVGIGKFEIHRVSYQVYSIL